MKQLLILSGKGGTGKTTIASAFIRLSGAHAYADCDVDAPNLHLVMEQNSSPKRTEYFGMPKARIESHMCIACGRCKENCRFNAIIDKDGYSVDPFACEGCGVCEVFCPVGAISLLPVVAGEQMLYADYRRVFSTAQLKTGSGTSGLLVTEVKKQMIAAAAKDSEIAVIDGSPGIGCPVIASLRGVDMVLIVAEPSISGISDMERIIITAEKFRTKIGVCINKYDTNLANTKKIEKYCQMHGLPCTGRIPFDPAAVQAINNGLTVTDIECPSGTAVQAVFKNTMRMLNEESDGIEI